MFLCIIKNFFFIKESGPVQNRWTLNNKNEPSGLLFKIQNEWGHNDTFFLKKKKKKIDFERVEKRAKFRIYTFPPPPSYMLIYQSLGNVYCINKRFIYVIVKRKYRSLYKRYQNQLCACRVWTKIACAILLISKFTSTLR